MIFQENWQNFIFVILVLAVIARIVLFIIAKVILVFVGKTKNKIDDMIVNRSKGPIFLLILLFGFKYAIETYYSTLPYQSEIFNSLILVFIIQLFVILTDVFFLHVAKKFTAKTEAHLDDQIVDILQRFSSIFIWAVGIAFILQSWSINIGPLLASMGVAGIAIAFALQTSLANVFGGISLILDKNIKIGDVLNIDNGYQMGKVLDIGLRSTKVRTFDGELLIIPNGKLADTSFINIAMPNPRARVKLPFTVAYGSDIKQVRKLITDVIIKNIKGLEVEEGVSVKFLEMGDSALKFTLYFYVDDYGNRLSAKDQANELIYNTLNKNRISIPFPQMDVTVKK